MNRQICKEKKERAEKRQRRSESEKKRRERASERAREGASRRKREERERERSCNGERITSGDELYSFLGPVILSFFLFPFQVCVQETKTKS